MATEQENTSQLPHQLQDGEDQDYGEQLNGTSEKAGDSQDSQPVKEDDVEVQKQKDEVNGQEEETQQNGKKDEEKGDEKAENREEEAKEPDTQPPQDEEAQGEAEEATGDKAEKDDEAETGSKRKKDEQSQDGANKKQKQEQQNGDSKPNGNSKVDDSKPNAAQASGKVGSKHDEPLGDEMKGSTERLPKKGQQVQWKALPGYVDGEVVEILTEEKDVDGKNVKASKDEPRIVLKSNSSGKICVHKPDAVHFE